MKEGLVYLVAGTCTTVGVLEASTATRADGRFVCALCFGVIPLHHKNTHVDHCHVTGRVRGILCHKCNLRIGVLEARGEQGLQADFTYLGSR